MKEINIAGLRKAFSSRKFIVLISTILGTYGVYGFGFAPPEGVVLALIGLASVYIGSQAWVDTNTIEEGE